jgi:hypothetical protein
MKRDFQRAAVVCGLKEAAGALILLAAIFVPATFAAAASSDEVIAWLKVGDDPAAMMENRGVSHRDPTEYEQYRKTQAALIKSPEVLRAALGDPAIANLKLVTNQQRPLDWLKENLSVKFPLESEVLQISLKADNQAEAVKIVNAVADSYLKNVVEVERQQILAQYDLIDRHIKGNLAYMAEKREQLSHLSARKGIPSAGLSREQFSTTVALSADLRKKLYEIELQIIASRIRAEDNDSAAERRRAKTELSIAESQKKFLLEKQAEVAEELAKLRIDAVQDNAGVSILGEDIKRKEEITKDLELKLQRLSLLTKMPSRVTVLQRASE